VLKTLKTFKVTADIIAASLLAAMSIVFIYQIFTRYFGSTIEAVLGVDLSYSWTLEVLLTLWVWLVFWGSAFCLSEREHIRFDSLYLALPKKVQRIVAAISALVIAVFLVISFLPTLDYITFYKIKKSASLRIRLDMYSVSMVCFWWPWWSVMVGVLSSSLSHPYIINSMKMQTLKSL
jgi:TRAP-type C4-dicarboxylate transport system permease small subunit